MTCNNEQGHLKPVLQLIKYIAGHKIAAKYKPSLFSEDHVKQKQ